MRPPCDDEKSYRERSRTLFRAGVAEREPVLREVLLLQSSHIAMKAIRLELARRMEALLDRGESIIAPQG